MYGWAGDVAIAGIGATAFSRDSGHSEQALATQAALAALSDAGLSADAVDGLVCFTHDTTVEMDLARDCGFGDITFLDRVASGGGSCCATIGHAAMAIAAGVATTIVCFRSFNGRSRVRYGQGITSGLTTAQGYLAWVAPFGLQNAASWMAMVAQRYLYDFNIDQAVFGEVALTQRAYARNNPAAVMRSPLTIDDYEQSPWVTEPLRKLDCCLETDGAVAFVITSSARARNCRNPVVVVRAAAEGAEVGKVTMSSYYHGDATAITEAQITAQQLWRQAQLSANDIDVAMLYDHFSPSVLLQLEAYGFCARGEAPDFVRSGETRVGGRLPTNTHGGMLSEAYVHGMNSIAEAVRQLRGTAANQIAGAKRALVTGGPLVPTSGLILEAG